MPSRRTRPSTGAGTAIWSVDRGARNGTPTNASCEVRYWRNAAIAGAGQSLWRSDSDLADCAARARELIARLEAPGGWRCTSSEPATPAGEADGGSGDQDEDPPADVSVAEFGELQPRSRDLATSTETFSPDVPTTAQPGASAARPPSLDVARTAPSCRVSGTALACRCPDRALRSADVAVILAVDRPDRAVASTGGAATLTCRCPGRAVSSYHLTTATSEHPDAALLDRVVEQTLRSVQELYGGQFQAELAAFGDLDRDGLKDAAVLVTYQADQQYVLVEQQEKKKDD